MERIGVVSPEQMHAMWQDYLTRQQLAPQIRYNYPQRRPVEDVSPHRVKVKNTTSEVIPAFACMRITGVEDIGGQTCIKVEKPTSTDGEFLFNGPFPIAIPADATEDAPEELGVGWAFRHGVITMLGDAPTYAGAMYGPTVSSWEISEGGGAFVVYGRQDISSRALLGQIGTRKLMVVLDADLPAATHALTGGSSCLATICRWNSADGDAIERGTQITVWNHAESTSHAEDTYGGAEWIAGHWHFLGDCDPMAAR